MSFVRGILADYDAVRTGLTLHHNCGPVEGNVTRIKMIKRKMYGRAGFDLLRKLVVLGP
jgi:transposase